MLRQQRIIQAALDLFATQGIEATSVQQITDRAGISKGAFYLSFKTKDDLIYALIDHFMMQITSRIDQSVRNTADDSQLLYEFYYTTFDTFNQYSSFTKIFIREQSHTFNKALMSKMHHYNQLIDQTITNMIERLYGDHISSVKYDVIFMIKAMMKSFAELLIIINFPADLDRLSRSLAEKTEMLAKHSKVPFVTKELSMLIKHPIHQQWSKDQLIELIRDQLNVLSDAIVKESLELLKDELLSPSLRPALIHGLIKNIEKHPETEWIAFLLSNFMLKRE